MAKERKEHKTTQFLLVLAIILLLVIVIGVYSGSAVGEARLTMKTTSDGGGSTEIPKEYLYYECGDGQCNSYYVHIEVGQTKEIIINGESHFFTVLDVGYPRATVKVDGDTKFVMLGNTYTISGIVVNINMIYDDTSYWKSVNWKGVKFLLGDTKEGCPDDCAAACEIFSTKSQCDAAGMECVSKIYTQMWKYYNSTNGTCTGLEFHDTQTIIAGCNAGQVVSECMTGGFGESEPYYGDREIYPSTSPSYLCCK